MIKEYKKYFKIMLFLAIGFGLIMYSVSHMYWRDYSKLSYTFDEWYLQNLNLLKGGFCYIFSLITLFISFTIENSKFNLKKSMNRLVFSGFWVSFIYSIVGMIVGYTLDDIVFCIVKYLFIIAFLFIVFRIEHKIFFKG